MKTLVIIAVIASLSFVVYKTTRTQSADTRAGPSNRLEASQQVAQKSTTTNDALNKLMSEAADDAEVFIVEPKNGAVVSSPVLVVFGIRNMSIAKAGDNQELSGHHHLLINLEELPDMKAPLPASDQLIHFGGAQTETTIELSPGTHTLQLLLGNYLHIPHKQPVLSEKITITVE